jgi:hypothetical protein
MKMILPTLALWATVLGFPVALVAAWLTWKGTANPWKSRRKRAATSTSEISHSIMTEMNRKVIDVPWETHLDVIHMYEQHGHRNQQWYLRQNEDGTFKIISCLTRRCMEIQDASGLNAARVRQAEYVGAQYQHWVITRLGGGVYRIHNRATGKCLDVLGWNTSDRADLGQWECNGEANQRWIIDPPI